MNLWVKLLQKMFLNPLVHANQASAKSKLLQVSSDGPNINLSFPDLLEEDRNEKQMSQFVHIGTCGLHTLHNSMKHGEKA